MNGYINELIERVGTDVSGKWMSRDKVHELTTLVVNECITLLQPNNERVADANVDVLKSKIKQHFGVEE